MTGGRGFTLVEVMVALAVVAVALPALLLSLSQQLDSTGYLRDKSLAHMVAANKLAEIRILSRARNSLLQGKDSGVTRMVERDWYWWVDSQPTAVERFFRISIKVAAGEASENQPLYSLEAFMSTDLVLAAEPDPAAAAGSELTVGSGSGGSR